MTDYIIKATYRSRYGVGLPDRVTIHRATCAATRRYDPRGRSRSRHVTRERAIDALSYAQPCKLCKPDLEDV